MKKIIRSRQWFPRWEMPSDPVRAVWWFLHWLLKLAVNFFWLPIIAVSIFEAVINWRVGGSFNGIVSGLLALLVGVIVWTVLIGMLMIINIMGKVKQVIDDATHIQQTLNQRNPYASFMQQANREPEGPIVEGSITDLDEERRKRR